MDDNNNKNNNNWKIVKEIPLALILALGLQLGGGIWWAATFSQEMKTLIKEVSTMKNESYTQKEAEKDKALMNFKIDDVSNRVRNLEDKR